MWNTENNPLMDFTEGRESKQSECFKNDLSEFTLKSGQNSSFFPANCAIGIFNSSLPIDMEHSRNPDSETFNYEKANPFCGECKPGYRARRHPFMNLVFECQ